MIFYDDILKSIILASPSWGLIFKLMSTSKIMYHKILDFFPKNTVINAYYSTKEEFISLTLKVISCGNIKYNNRLKEVLFERAVISGNIDEVLDLLSMWKIPISFEKDFMWLLSHPYIPVNKKQSLNSFVIKNLGLMLSLSYDDCQTWLTHLKEIDCILKSDIGCDKLWCMKKHQIPIYLSCYGKNITNEDVIKNNLNYDEYPELLEYGVFTERHTISMSIQMKVIVPKIVNENIKKIKKNYFTKCEDACEKYRFTINFDNLTKLIPTILLYTSDKDLSKGILPNILANKYGNCEDDNVTFHCIKTLIYANYHLTIQKMIETLVYDLSDISCRIKLKDLFDLQKIFGDLFYTKGLDLLIDHVKDREYSVGVKHTSEILNEMNATKGQIIEF